MKSFGEIIPKSLVKVDLKNCFLPTVCTFKFCHGLLKSSEGERPPVRILHSRSCKVLVQREISEVLEF